jgi:hypothetical protein
VQDQLAERADDEEGEEPADAVDDRQRRAGLGEPPPAPRKRPVPIAPPMAIMFTCRDLRAL